MQKQVEVSLKKNNKQQLNIKIKGILKKNKITYVENKIVNVLDFDEEILKRRSEEYILILDFKNEKIYYNNQFELNIKVIDKTINESNVKIKYKIVELNEVYEYHVKW